MCRWFFVYHFLINRKIKSSKTENPHKKLHLYPLMQLNIQQSKAVEL
jgi:hypothetical protein